jgi:hypothetical protein
VPEQGWVRNRLIAGTLALLATRLILSLLRTGPVLVADEIGYLTNARVLTGGLEGQLERAPFYRGGYSLLLSPLLELSSDPGFVYHLVLVLNAVLAASVFPLLYLLLTRFAGVPPRIAIWAALAGAAYPAVTALSQTAMSENALVPLICVWLIAFGGLLAARELHRSLLWAAGLGASTAALWAVHGRMVSAVVLTAVVVGWLGVRRRLHPGTVVTVGGVLAAGLWAADLLNAYLIDHNYGGSAPNEASERLGELWDGHGLRTAAANLLGQTWYLAVASFGLAAVVFARALEFARPRRTSARDGLSPVIPIVAALTVLLLGISAVAFPDRTRPDMLIYGRYVEVVTSVLVAFGVALLAQREVPTRLARPLLAVALLTAVVVVIRATAADPDPANRWNVSGLPFVTANLGPGILIGAALVAGAGAWLLVRLSLRASGRVGWLAVALFAPIIVYGVWNPVLKSEHAVYPGGWTSPEPIAESHGIRTIGYDLSHYDAIGLYAFQWFLPDTSVALFDARRQAPPSRFVISGRGWQRRRAGAGADELWRAEGRDQVLWRDRGF